MNKLVSAVITGLLITFESQAASFDCNLASTFIEHAICNYPKTSQLDEELGILYKKLIEKSKEDEVLNIKSNQKTWLKNIRDKCTDTLCLNNAYTDRINRLREQVSPITTNTNQTIPVIFSGIVKYASLDSSIDGSNGESIGFLSKSKIASKIFATCGDGTLCEVKGSVDKNQFLVDVSEVKLLNQSSESHKIKETNKNESTSVELLFRLAASLYTSRQTYLVMTPQWELNERWGAPPISQNMHRMHNEDYFILLKKLSKCSVKINGQEINDETIEKYIESSTDKDIKQMKAVLNISKLRSPQVPKRKDDLNSMSNMDTGNKFMLFDPIHKITSKSDWCDDFIKEAIQDKK